MEKINIAEILKDCPKGMELNCVLFENVTFEGIKQDEYPIIVKIKEPPMTLSLTKTGGWNSYNSAKCVIYPKGKTTWEGFVPPCEFKTGDVLFVDCSDSDDEDKSYQYIFILNDPDFYGKWHSYCHLDGVGCFHSEETYLTDDEYHPRFATEEEKTKLFDAIKSNGYKWNSETKTLEKLPKFKVGDRVCNKNYKDYIYDIHDITDKGYRAKEINADSPILILFGSQEDNYELVPNKFDVINFEPFMKVLVRDNNEQFWTCDWFSFHDISQVYPFACVGHYVSQCIPYEENQHLLGTTTDCDEYYKNWE